MKRNLVLILAVLGLTLSASRVTTAAILSGSYSYDPVGDLYTYGYVLDNALGPAPINELSVLIHSGAQDFSLSPISHTDPASWSFQIAVSGTSAEPPLNEYGTFWQWWNGVGLAVGSTASGFSFTTNLGPTFSTTNNYFLYSASYTGGPPNIGGGGVVEWGHIVAPDFVPEPSGLLALASGLLGIGGVCWRRKR